MQRQQHLHEGVRGRAASSSCLICLVKKQQQQHAFPLRVPQQRGGHLPVSVFVRSLRLKTVAVVVHLTLLLLSSIGRHLLLPALCGSCAAEPCQASSSVGAQAWVLQQQQQQEAPKQWQQQPWRHLLRHHYQRFSVNPLRHLWQWQQLQQPAWIQWQRQKPAKKREQSQEALLLKQQHQQQHKQPQSWWQYEDQPHMRQLLHRQQQLPGAAELQLYTYKRPQLEQEISVMQKKQHQQVKRRLLQQKQQHLCGKQHPSPTRAYVGNQKQQTTSWCSTWRPVKAQRQQCLQHQQQRNKGAVAASVVGSASPHTNYLQAKNSEIRLFRCVVADCLSEAVAPRQLQQKAPSEEKPMLHRSRQHLQREIKSPPGISSSSSNNCPIATRSVIVPLQQLQGQQQYQKHSISAGGSVTLAATQCYRSSDSALRSIACTSYAQAIPHIWRADWWESLDVRSARCRSSPKRSSSGSRKRVLLQPQSQRPSRISHAHRERKTGAAWVEGRSSVGYTRQSDWRRSAVEDVFRLCNSTTSPVSGHRCGHRHCSGRLRCRMVSCTPVTGPTSGSRDSSSGNRRTRIDGIVSGSSFRSRRQRYDIGALFSWCSGSSSGEKQAPIIDGGVYSVWGRGGIREQRSTGAGVRAGESSNKSVVREIAAPLVRRKTTQLRIGTRRSPLAMAQARQVVFLLSMLCSSEFPGAFELVQKLLQRKQQLEAAGEEHRIQDDWLGSLLLPHEEKQAAAIAASIALQPRRLHTTCRCDSDGDTAVTTAPAAASLPCRTGTTTSRGGVITTAANNSNESYYFFSPWGRLEYGELQLVPLETTGDRLQQIPLALDGGKGLFTKELDVGLLQHSIDMAVHSMKDVPALLQRETLIAAFLPREDPRDVLLFADRCNTSPTSLPNHGLGLPLLPLPYHAASYTTSHNISSKRSSKCSTNDISGRARVTAERQLKGTRNRSTAHSKDMEVNFSNAICEGDQGKSQKHSGNETHFPHRQPDAEPKQQVLPQPEKSTQEQKPPLTHRLQQQWRPTDHQQTRSTEQQQQEQRRPTEQQQQQQRQQQPRRTEHQQQLSMPMDQQRPQMTEEQQELERQQHEQLSLLQSLPWSPLTPYLPNTLLTWSSPAGQAAAAAAAATTLAATAAASRSVMSESEDVSAAGAADAAADAATVAAAALIAGAAYRRVLRNDEAHSKITQTRSLATAAPAAGTTAMPPTLKRLPALSLGLLTSQDETAATELSPPDGSRDNEVSAGVSAIEASNDGRDNKVSKELGSAQLSATVAKKGELRELCVGLRVGTCSLRRQALLASLLPYPLVSFVGLRGNVHTRIKRLQQDHMDATLLAAAGLRRLRLLAPLLQKTWHHHTTGLETSQGAAPGEAAGRVTAVAQEKVAAIKNKTSRIAKNEEENDSLEGVGAVLLPPWLMIPSVCQGIVGVQCRANDARVRMLLQRLDCYTSRMEAACERAFLGALDGSCRTPIAGISIWGRYSAAAASRARDNCGDMQSTAESVASFNITALADEIAAAQRDCNEQMFRRLRNQEQRRAETSTSKLAAAGTRGQATAVDTTGKATATEGDERISAAEEEMHMRRGSAAVTGGGQEGDSYGSSKTVGAGAQRRGVQRLNRIDRRGVPSKYQRQADAESNRASVSLRASQSWEEMEQEEHQTSEAASTDVGEGERQQLQFYGALATPDGVRVFKVQRAATVSTPEEAAALGNEAGMHLRARVGEQILRTIQRQVTENTWATAASTLY